MLLKEMEMITLSYDASNKTIRKLINSLISSGIFIKKESTLNNYTIKAIEEIKNGGGTRCNSFDEYLEAVK